MADEIKEVKPGVQTTEFWLTLLMTGLLQQPWLYRSPWIALAMTLLVIGYTISRGLAKK